MTTIYVATIFSRFHGECLGICCGINMLGFKGEFLREFASKYYCASPYIIAIEFDNSYKEEQAARYITSHYGIIPMKADPIAGYTIEDVEKNINEYLAKVDFDCDFNDFIKETISIEEFIKQQPFDKRAMEYFKVKE